jgi:hypothetical protein
VDIELDPPRGVTGIALGLSLDEGVAAAARYGQVTVSAPQPAQVEVAGETMSLPTKVLALGDGFEVSVHVEDGVSVTAIEVWRPRDPQADVRVLYDGIDVFGTPALRVLELLEARGHAVDRDDEPEYYSVPDLPLGFTRVAGHEVPLADDGEPLYFEAVLVGGPGYYDLPPQP